MIKTIENKKDDNTKERKRIVLSLVRRKSNLLLFGILFFLAFFLLVFVSIYNVARKNIASIEKTYGTSFSIDLILDQADSDVWENRYVEELNTTLKAYIGPVVDEPLVSRIAEEVERIIDYEIGCRALVLLDEYEPIPGYWYWAYEDYLINKENYSIDMEEAKYHMYGVECWYYGNSYRYEQFYNGAFRLVEGRHITPEDTFKCIVSKAFAQKNNLTLGDSLKIGLNSLVIRAGYPIESLGTVEAEIVGLFETTYKQPVGQHTNERDILENYVITDIATGYALDDFYDGNHALAISQFFVENPEDIDEVMKEVEKLDWIDWRYYVLEKDDATYKDAVKPLRTMKTMMLVCLIVFLTAGILLLYLVTTHSMKKRVRETGILMSLGITGVEIRKQFLLEHLIIGTAAFFFAFIVSFAVTPSIGDRIYGSINKGEEQQFYTDEEIQAVYIRGDRMQAAEMAKNQKTGLEAPEEVETEVGVVTVLIVFAAMMFIIYWSVDAVIKKTMRLEPIRVLSMIT